MTAVEWLFNQLLLNNLLLNQGTKVHKEMEHKIIEQAKEMEKEEKEPLLNYIKDVRDVCGKHYHPTETELHYLSIRAENILATFKSE